MTKIKKLSFEPILNNVTIIIHEVWLVEALLHASISRGILAIVHMALNRVLGLKKRDGIDYEG
jgi:hypothetical protein